MDADVPFGPSDVALFLDVDGTLLEIAPRPQDVRADSKLLQMLQHWSTCSGGAVALISGRSLSALDEIFPQLMLPAAGLHGFERRNALGEYSRLPQPPSATLDRLRRLLTDIAARAPGLLLEDKRFALALHYRLAPQLEQEVIADVKSAARTAHKDFDLQRGRKVVELRPRSATKARAVAQFMEEPPFAGRTPVYIGDDLTDEGAFEWVNAHAGVSIAVDVHQRATAARHLLSGVRAVRANLERNLRAWEIPAP
jgi:trehalose 6-phosphate phosphatase